MVWVDSYLIPVEEAEQYIADREFCAAEAAKVMERFCTSVSREWAGSEDGEAVVGVDQHGEILCMIHLDPTEIDRMMEEIQKGQLKEFLFRVNELEEKPDGSVNFIHPAT